MTDSAAAGDRGRQGAAEGGGATRQIRKVLIANRGEIAVRVLRTLREMEIRSAVVFSQPDRATPAVTFADEAYEIGPAPSSKSYLRGEAILDLAERIGADAIHPGYGFLSENAAFAAACEERGVRLIGPSSSSMAAMGSKIESRRLMMAAGVPVVPGGTDPLPDLDAARAAADEVGYPIMLKASAGGGGKGMRLVRAADQLESAFRAATSEAGSSFGDSSVYVERFVENPRHVEIQVLADEHGNAVSLGERECSLQRRHQKVVEEAPSAVVDPDLRRRMGEAAVQAALAVGYSNAGTVEFLLAPDGAFYFLEMNTRLQVEHPVTELVTGLDLVAWQIRVARGERLDPSLARIEPNGHAIEVRVYAEDPFKGFAPSPGVIQALRLPEGPGVRNDFGIDAGSEVSIHYDPMLGKLIVWGEDRDQAIRRMRRALAEIRIGGIRTTVPLFEQIFRDEDFCAGRLDIGMLDRKLASGEFAAPERPVVEAGEGAAPIEAVLRLAALIAHVESQGQQGSASGGARAAERAPRRWGQLARLDALRGRR
ncbi:MAG: acetyl-CoA carboxylase biotin carboxylase subunit [Acidobacteria bacterium]|nr:MAG: acetyl-CoA carboxylase biotin carboxylase subunit [Acidobacteriota bacterium]